jgi:hypothetical protein
VAAGSLNRVRAAIDNCGVGLGEQSDLWLGGAPGPIGHGDRCGEVGVNLMESAREQNRQYRLLAGGFAKG